MMNVDEMVDAAIEGNKMSEEINQDRRRFPGTAAMTIAAARLGMIGSAKAQSGARPQLSTALGGARDRKSVV